MHYLELLLILFFVFIIFLNSIFSYYKGIKKSKISMVITICLYIFFIITSMFIDSSFLLPFIKNIFNIIDNRYNTLIVFIFNIILKILYFILLYIISFIIEKIITRKCKNKKEFKASIIGFIKGVIHSILLLCILNYNIRSLPSYNEDNEGIYKYVEMENKEVLFDLINDYKDGKLVNVTVSFDENVSKVMSYSFFDNQIISLNDELLKITDLVNKINTLENISYQNIYEIILLADKCNCLDAFKDFLSFYIEGVDLTNISLEKEIDTILKIINEIKSNSNINLISSYLYDLKTLDYLVYILLDNINTSLLNEEILNILKDACINNYIHEDVYLINNLYEYFVSYLLDNDLSKLINNNLFINELFKSKFINFVFPSILSYINDLYKLDLDINVINDINIKKEASILIPLAYNVYKGEIVFDKKMLDNVLNSELLSQLLIKSIVDSTFNKGLLAKYNKYIDIPTYLNDINNLKWKDELPIIVDVFKNIDFNDEYIIDSIVNNINIEEALKSEVIYYSLSKILLNNNYLVFNYEDLLITQDKVLINKDMICELFDLLSEFKGINYQDIISLSLTNLNLNNIDFEKILDNQVIRNTLSSLFGFLNIPSNTYDDKVVYLDNKKSTLKQIKKIELLNIINLLKRVNIVNISSIDQILDLFINNKSFIENSLTYNHSAYSKILHDNISTYIINQIKTLPEINVNHIINKYQNEYIEAKEILNIINTLYIFKQNNIDFQKESFEEIIYNIFDIIVKYPNILESYIVKDIVNQYMELYL